MRESIFGFFVLALCSGVAAREQPASAEPASQVLEQATQAEIFIPPKPRPQVREGMSPTERSKAMKTWQAESRAWRESLTKEQRQELLRREKERQRRWREEDEKARRLPARTDSYDWRTVAAAWRLESPVVEQLGRDKLAYGPSLRQSFEPYLHGPIFVTSDSVLNGFHVLFADAFRALEERRSVELRNHLEAVWRQVQAYLAERAWPATDTAPALRHAQRVLGPAVVLLGANLESIDADVRGDVAAEVAKIRAAAAVELPAWLGPPAPTLMQLDYRRLKPVGFYAGSPRLSDYFRAVRWLQMVPFRADRPDELGAIALLGSGVGRLDGAPAKAFFRDYDSLLGPSDGQDLGAAGETFRSFLRTGRRGDSWGAQLAAQRRSLLERFNEDGGFGRLLQDDRLPPEVENRLGEIEFRILAPRRLPDAVLLQTLANGGVPPQALAVAVMLGSEFARERLRGMATQQFDAALAAAHSSAENEGRRRPTFYDDYLEVLRSAQGALPTDAPEVFRSKSWEAKSCQTVLASWAQMRHTFTLQAAPSANYLGLIRTPPGFVEPNPEFFSRFADMIERAEREFEERGVFRPLARLEAETLREEAAFLESLGREWPADGRSVPPEATERYLQLRGDLERHPERLPGWRHAVPDVDAPVAEQEAFRREWISRLQSVAERYEKGEAFPPEGDGLLRRRWETLVQVSRRLEALAHKQLRRVPWSDAENAFLRSYGERLAFVMGYLGNSWLSPVDDAPRWAEIHRLPAENRLLAVGVGRPRTLFVLYPWDGREILCQGSVMPFYEYAARTRLRDDEWLRVLDSPDCPPLPDWIGPDMQLVSFTNKRGH